MFAMITTGRMARRWLLLAILFSAAVAQADLQVAQIAPMSGPIGEEGKAYNLGISVALAAANARGGVGGQTLTLKTLDDAYNPDRAIELIRGEAGGRTLALLLPVGSPAMTRILKEKVLDSVRIPVVGVIPGAEPLRKPSNPYVFHVRAGDLDQYGRIIEHVLTIGMKRVAVVHADIPFGKAGLAEVGRLLKAAGHELTASAAFPISAEIDFSAVLSTLRQTVPDVVVLISPAQPAGQFVRQYHAAGLASPVMTLSYGLANPLPHRRQRGRKRGRHRPGVSQRGQSDDSIVEALPGRFPAFREIRHRAHAEPLRRLRHHPGPDRGLAACRAEPGPGEALAGTGVAQGPGSRRLRG